MISEATLDRIAREILLAGAMEIRDVPATVSNEQVPSLLQGAQPFLYASGNWGPGYVTIKGQVSDQPLMVMLCKYLALEIAEKWPAGVDFIAGNVTGGVVPGWEVSRALSDLLGKTIPFVYIRELRKTGGHKELITGIQHIPADSGGLDMEELVNFAQTIVNGAKVLREAGHNCSKGACILYYGNPEADKQLAAAGIEMVYLITLSELLDVAEKVGIGERRPYRFAERLADYRQFLWNPLQWQADRGLTHVEKGGTK